MLAHKFDCRQGSGTKPSFAVKESISESQDIERLQCIVDRLPAGVLILDTNGVIIDCNPAAINLLQQDLLGVKWSTVIETAVIPGVSNNGNVHLTSGKIVTIGTQALLPKQGQLILITDVSSTDQLTDKLHHYKRLSAMGKMAAQLAHQIRTPLAAALLYSKNLINICSKETFDKEQCVKFTNKIVTRIKNIEDQISDMLAFSRGKCLEFSEISLADLANDVIQSILPQVEESSANLSIRFTPESLRDKYIHGNLNALSGSIQNCINNSLEIIKDDAEIYLTFVAEDHDEVIIIIQDNGPGIEADLQQKIFEPFYSTRENGTGLGLAVVKMVVESHRGQIAIDSEKFKGTAIKFKLKLLKEK